MLLDEFVPGFFRAQKCTHQRGPISIAYCFFQFHQILDIGIEHPGAGVRIGDEYIRPHGGVARSQATEIGKAPRRITKNIGTEFLLNQHIDDGEGE